jgi:hypothetical protein
MEEMMEQLTRETLKTQNQRFCHTAGVSHQNNRWGYLPGFLDEETGSVYPSCKADGTLAPIHVMDGLPESLITARSASGRAAAVKRTVIAGFIKEGHFYTREQVANALA